MHGVNTAGMYTVGIVQNDKPNNFWIVTLITASTVVENDDGDGGGYVRGVECAFGHGGHEIQRGNLRVGRIFNGNGGLALAGFLKIGFGSS
ncbi:hypothetical protein VNO80_03883 [Phaseolus coccineus]|uniref:Uncharacterized protein n=1 Tax=Phaseolus coccineus TaxID=3886 RepID=A0AAN9RMY5_PHACN